jgi:hypothetical protein
VGEAVRVSGGGDERVSRERDALGKVQLTQEDEGSAPGFIPFPSAGMDDANTASFPLLRTPTPPHSSISPAFPTMETQEGADDVDEVPAGSMPVLDLSTLKERSREELERMLQEADRLIRTKEEGAFS